MTGFHPVTLFQLVLSFFSYQVELPHLSPIDSDDLVQHLSLTWLAAGAVLLFALFVLILKLTGVSDKLVNVSEPNPFFLMYHIHRKFDHQPECTNK